MLFVLPSCLGFRYASLGHFSFGFGFYLFRSSIFLYIVVPSFFLPSAGTLLVHSAIPVWHLVVPYPAFVRFVVHSVLDFSLVMRSRILILIPCIFWRKVHPRRWIPNFRPFNFFFFTPPPITLLPPSLALPPLRLHLGFWPPVLRSF